MKIRIEDEEITGAVIALIEARFADAAVVKGIRFTRAKSTGRVYAEATVEFLDKEGD